MKRTSLIATFTAALAIAFGRGATLAQNSNTLYDPNPDHSWNRLNEALFVRTAPDGKKFGVGELDILYWRSTRNLLIGPSRERALAVLDDFIAKDGEKLIQEPLKRALLQRDLWDLFDWSAGTLRTRTPDEERGSRALQSRLVLLIRRLALTTNELAALPDNYAQTEKSNLTGLPRGLNESNGDWVQVGISGYNDFAAAPTHLLHFNGHSSFSVMLHLPKGREAALAYLDEVRSFAKTEPVLVYSTNSSTGSSDSQVQNLELNPRIPQFPINTEWALVRRMLVIDQQGQIQPTPITESIQMRRYLQIRRIIQENDNAQKFFEFQLNRRDLTGKLRRVTEDEKGFPNVRFMGKGIDLIETPFGAYAPDRKLADSESVKSNLMGTCFTCHSGPGIFSVLSFTRDLSADSPHRPADLESVKLQRETAASINGKHERFDWGLLQGLWQ